MRIRSSVFAALTALALVVSGCGSSASGDLLTRIQTNGVIRIATDPNYPPYSELVDGEYYDGFDIMVATLVANALEVEIEWVTPSWDALTAGNWGDRWDISVGSMAQTTKRGAVIDFSEPYYYANSFIAVPTSSTAASLADHAGLEACVGSGTIYESWLNGELADEKLIVVSSPPPAGITVTSQETDNLCIEALAAGRTWGFFIQSKEFIDNAIASGAAIKFLDNTVITLEKISIAFDKSGLSSSKLREEINAILAGAHANGILSQYSLDYLGVDVTKAP